MSKSDPEISNEWLQNTIPCYFVFQKQNQGVLLFELWLWYWLRYKAGSGGVCCHNARGRVRNRKSNHEADRPRDLTYYSHKPECIVTTNPDRSVLITIITWHFQLHIVNVSILQLKYEYGARSESRFACYSHCYITWCPLTTGIVDPQCPSARDAVLVSRYLTPLISACLKPLKRILQQ